MKFRIINLCLLFLLFQNSLLFATHIVGGDLQLNALQNNDYQLTLNLYFDAINGNSRALDNDVTVYMFARSDNALITSFILPLTKGEKVVYSNPICQVEELSTIFYQYTEKINLSPNNYRDSQGYYFVWERCCRNATINNIILPENMGMVFYLSIPALNIRNSSPQFNLPKGDYACLNEWFTFDFSAQDADRDQLVYSLETPLAGNSTNRNPIPPPFSLPYRTVSWQTGFSQNNAIQGNPSLQINAQTGQLSMRPTQRGLYVFTVKCEEFRNGVKIGETRRDFQLLVIDCPVNNSPQITLIDDKGVKYQEGQTLTIFADKPFCLPILVNDADANEQISLSIRTLNFNNPAIKIENPKGVIFQANSPYSTNFCWAECTFSQNSGDIFLVEIIVQDDGCPLPKADTLQLNLVVLPIANAAPMIFTDLQENTIKLRVDSTFRFQVKGLDNDGDSIRIFAQGKGFELSTLGMQFTEVKGKGKTEGSFQWLPTCSAVKDATTPYQVNFIIQDKSLCFRKTDTLTVTLLLEDKPFEEEKFLPPNVFTPNNDGKNDKFEMRDFPMETCLFGFEKIEILNRWGGKVF